MVLNEQKYTEDEYEGLVMELMQSADIDAELQYRRQSILNYNRKFYLMMFRTVGKIRDAAIQSNDTNLISALDRFESKLYEHTNVIPADLPDSILSDSDLVGRYLADHSTVSFVEKDWLHFQTVISRKSNEIPKELELPFLEWCEKMLKMNYERHKIGCKNPIDCHKNQGYDRRLQYVSKLIEEVTPEQTELLPIPLNLPLQDSGLRLSDRKGAKIDFIRVVNAMHLLGFFKDQNNRDAHKLTVMKAFGAVLGIDLSDYDKDLSQAYQTYNSDLNTKIFKELADITKEKIEKK